MKYFLLEGDSLNVKSNEEGQMASSAPMSRLAQGETSDRVLSPWQCYVWSDSQGTARLTVVWCWRQHSPGTFTNFSSSSSESNYHVNITLTPAGLGWKYRFAQTRSSSSPDFLRNVKDLAGKIFVSRSLVGLITPKWTLGLELWAIWLELT